MEGGYSPIHESHLSLKKQQHYPTPQHTPSDVLSEPIITEWEVLHTGLAKTDRPAPRARESTGQALAGAVYQAAGEWPHLAGESRTEQIKLQRQNTREKEGQKRNTAIRFTPCAQAPACLATSTHKHTYVHTDLSERKHCQVWPNRSQESKKNHIL